MARSETILERRVRARLAALGMNLDDVVRTQGCGLQSLHNWFSGGLTPRGREVLRNALAVDDAWLDSESMEDIGAGLDAIAKV